MSVGNSFNHFPSVFSKDFIHELLLNNTSRWMGTSVTLGFSYHLFKNVIYSRVESFWVPNNIRKNVFYNLPIKLNFNKEKKK